MGTIKNVLCPLSEGRQIGGARQGVSSAVVGRLPVRARMECGIISTKAQGVGMKRDENQNVEYKESWHEKYLEWICGYANAKGGTLYIGIEDGTKKPVGVKNANKLMEDIPNSIRNTMGIVADVAMLKKLNEDYEKLSVNLGKRMPVLESESDYFRVTLPNLLYGFTDEQLVAAVDNSSYGVPKSETLSLATHHDAHHDTHHDVLPLKPNETKLLKVLSLHRELSATDLRKAMKLRNAPDFRERYLRPLSRDGYIEFTLPNAKKSKLQKYRLTDKGRAALSANTYKS